MADMRDTKLDFTLKELTFSRPAEHEDVPGSSSTVELQDKKLVCVEYPGVFSSADRMLATLGGEQKVTKTYSNPSKRLELRYRPQDPFCHSLYGNRIPSGNLLLRVRRRTRKNDPKDAEIHMDMLGVIGTTYKFTGLADFQCLAVHSEGGKHTSLYDKIILRKPESQEFFEQPMPYFLPPPIFSRLDSPVDYFYRPDVHLNQMPGDSKNFIGLNRAGRPHNAIFVSFTDPVVPAECLEAAKVTWKRICMNECDKKAEEQLKKMFESRPIWSRNAVKANINLHPDKLKLLLPFYAYYMVTGPWRSLWVKLGYDPRKTPEAKKYQMLDFRIRCSSKHGYLLSNIPIKAKRSSLNYSLPNTLNKSAPQPASVMDLPTQEGPSSSRDPAPVTYQLKESSYIFREGMLPPHRQMFYQVCDLDVESIQKEIEQNNGNEQHCDERDGWCVVGTTDKLRDMISAMIKAVIRAQKPVLPELPKRRRRKGQSVKDVYAEEEEDEVGEYENREDEEEDEEDEFQPSEGSENEMETEILDYM
ncbi:general transcription factor 3C polypeptide 5 [Simochromis diagramma]|uniref:general transcription factor 3C polypeptide 5 n=1 Tax=Simochromis diagramma TaxID=43689 RepID=UPI001A7EF835|nr:general transcription factor 3C polypeptide 5 [Simochromis diagramma]